MLTAVVVAIWSVQAIVVAWIRPKLVIAPERLAAYFVIVVIAMVMQVAILVTALVIEAMVVLMQLVEHVVAATEAFPRWT